MGIWGGHLAGRLPFRCLALLASLSFEFLRYLYVPTRYTNHIEHKQVRKQCLQSTSL
jgi:hypothetical protein